MSLLNGEGNGERSRILFSLLRRERERRKKKKEKYRHVILAKIFVCI